MLVSVNDFAEQRGVDRDTITTFIRRNPDIKKQTKRDGKYIVIDTESEAYQLLNKQYPLPSPVQVIEDTESQKELIKAQKFIIHLQQEQSKMIEQLAASKATVLLLEEKSNQVETLEKRLEASEAEKRQQIEEFKKQIAINEEEKRYLQEKLDQEQAKKWWQKLFS